MKKTLAAIISLTLVMVMYAPLAVAESVPTSATIDGSGSPPSVEKIFILDDTGDPTHVIPETQIIPNPGSGNDIVETEFWKYVVVSDPNGMDDIAAVYEYLIDTNGIKGPEAVATEVVDFNEQVAALDSALAQRLITLAEYDDLKFKLDPLKKQARMFKVRNTLTNKDAPGDYFVSFKVVDSIGGTSFGERVIQYLPLKALEVDFRDINYGPVSINVEKWVAGNDIFSPGDGKPTVKNQGNVPFQIVVSADDMVGANLGQFIDAQHLSVELLGQHVNGLGSPVVLDGLLQVCTPTQISFDIKAPLGTAADTYSGTITVEIADVNNGET